MHGHGPGAAADRAVLHEHLIPDGVGVVVGRDLARLAAERTLDLFDHACNVTSRAAPATRRRSRSDETLMKNCGDRASTLAFSSVSTQQTRSREPIRPPSGYENFLSRRQAAAALGFASEFKVRRLEKEGRLRPVRGVMGSAWYPRAQVLSVREQLAVPAAAPVAAPGGEPPLPVRWTDAQLIAHLRGRARAADGGAGSRPRTAVDLVADTGISIARAERVYRFWLAHDAHPVASEVRAGAAGRRTPAAPAERRSEARIERDALLAQMRDADPAVRAAAFEKLRASR